jgi:hypothetical protein
MATVSARLRTISRSLEKPSTLKEIRKLSLRDAATTAMRGLTVQNAAAEIKLRSGQQAGKELNRVEEVQGWKERKKLQQKLNLPFKLAFRWQKDALVPETDFERYVEETKGKYKEITEAGLRRASKKNKIPVSQSTAARVLKALSPWKNALHFKSIERKQYAGSAEELEQVRVLLSELVKRFNEVIAKLEE